MMMVEELADEVAELYEIYLWLHPDIAGDDHEIVIRDERRGGDPCLALSLHLLLDVQ